MKKEAKEILTIQNDEIKLSERSLEIDTKNQAPEMRDIVSQIKQTMRAKGLKHLSAPAIGEQRRIFCIDFEDLEIKTYINPILAECKGLTLSRETCECIPGKTFLVPRNNDITAIYQRPTGQAETRQFLGAAAIVFQHELNHLDGVLLSDIGLEIDEDFDNATEQERSEIIAMYLDSLDLRAKDLQNEIEEDPDLKEINDGIKFMEGIAKGEIKQDL